MASLVYKARVGALPVKGKIGAYEVLMATSPRYRTVDQSKGWPFKGLKDHDAAAQEAVEEAGVTGRCIIIQSSLLTE